jgi:hypothetical protein
LEADVAEVQLMTRLYKLLAANRIIVGVSCVKQNNQPGLIPKFPFRIRGQIELLLATVLASGRCKLQPGHRAKVSPNPFITRNIIPTNVANHAFFSSSSPAHDATCNVRSSKLKHQPAKGTQDAFSEHSDSLNMKYQSCLSNTVTIHPN